MDPPLLDRLPGYPKIYRDLTSRHASTPVREFLPQDPSRLDWIRPRWEWIRKGRFPREALARGMVGRLERLGAPPESLDGARALARPDSAVVLTGQQAGLFGGPLFTLFKALGTIDLARRAREVLGVPVVPLFWVGSNDHDLAEIGRVGIVSAERGVEEIEYLPGGIRDGTPAGRVRLDEGIVEAGRRLRRGDPPDPKLLEEWAPGEGWVEAFERTLLRWLGPSGLVVVDPGWPEVAGAAAPSLVEEVRSPSESSRLIAKTTRSLVEAGYGAQIEVEENDVHVFVDTEAQGRVRLVRRDGGFEIRGVERLEGGEVVRRIEGEPARWSPGAALRPLVADALFPALAHVAGPAEAAYYAQLRDLFLARRGAVPPVVPRPSATLWGGAAVRGAARLGLGLVDLAQGPARVLDRLTREALGSDPSAEVRRVEGTVAAGLDTLQEKLGKGDPPFVAELAEAARRRIDHVLSEMEQRLLKGFRRKDDERRAAVERAAAFLFPGGHLQERILGWVPALLHFGGETLERMRGALPMPALDHRRIEL